jgi:hypothetical protein
MQTKFEKYFSRCNIFVVNQYLAYICTLCMNLFFWKNKFWWILSWNTISGSILAGTGTRNWNSGFGFTETGM